MSRNYNRNARETTAGAGADVTRSVMGKNAIVTDGRTSTYQHTAADLISEARQLQELTAPAATADNTPHALLTNAEEIAYFRQKRREEMESLVQKNFRQLNCWLKYAEWEESQNDFIRARSVYERAIPNHGSRPQLWRQYAEMEMRCPPPPANKKLAAMDAASGSGIAGGVSVAAVTSNTATASSLPANSIGGAVSSDVLHVLGVTSNASGDNKNNSASSAPSAASSALMIIPSATSALTSSSAYAASGAGALVAISNVISTSHAADPLERMSKLEAIVARGGPNAVVARVRTVFDRALTSLPQCDDIWMKFILFETTIAATPEDDENVRRLFRRWMAYVDMPHVYELYVDFEVEMSHYAASTSAARTERVENLLKELVKSHNTLASWLFFADTMERKLGDPERAVTALKAAVVALGTYAKYGHRGALFQTLGRLLGSVGRWATEGRAALHEAIVEAKAIEERARTANNKNSNTNDTTANSESSAVPPVAVESSIVSETLLLAFTTLEKTFGSRDAAALDKLTILNQKLFYGGTLDRLASGHAMIARDSSVDAPNLALALRLVGCGRDERRLDARKAVLEEAYADLPSSLKKKNPTSSYVPAASLAGEPTAKEEEEEGGIEVVSGLFNAAVSSSTNEKEDEDDATGTRTNLRELKHRRQKDEEEELKILLRAVADHAALIKGWKSQSQQSQSDNAAPATLCESANDAYVNLVLGAVALLVKKQNQLGGENKVKSSSPAPQALQQARELVRTALDALPSHSALLWVSAAKLEVQSAAADSSSDSETSMEGRVRRIYGAAIANLSKALPPANTQSNTADFGSSLVSDENSSPAARRLHTIYDSYIGFEKAVGMGGLSTPAAPSSPSTSTPASSPSSQQRAVELSMQRLITSMGSSLSPAVPNSSSSSSSSPSAATVRTLYMEALKRFPCSVVWWVAFASYELELREPGRCFALLDKAEAVLKALQTKLVGAVSAATTSGATTTMAQRSAWEAAARDVQTRLDGLRGSRVGLMFQSGRGRAALDTFIAAVKEAMTEYAALAVTAVEGGGNRGSGGGNMPGGFKGIASPTAVKPQTQTASNINDTLVSLPSYRRLHDLLQAVPTLVTQMYAAEEAAARQKSDAVDDKKPRGDDVASLAYLHVNSLLRSLAVELRKSVGDLMTFTNVPMAKAICEPFLNFWRSYEGVYGSEETVAAVSCSAEAPAPPKLKAAAAAPATQATEAQGPPDGPVSKEAAPSAPICAPSLTAGKKRRRLADLAENY